MSIVRFFYEGFRNEQLYEELMASPALPLVRELEFKHGLKVIRKLSTYTPDHSEVDSWLMVNKAGIAVGQAYVAKNDDNKTVYCFRTPYFRKNRGVNSVDRETVSSVKLSSLMSTIARHEVIRSEDEMTIKKLNVLGGLMEQHRQSLGKSRKDTHGWDANEIHALLLKVLGVSTNSNRAYVDENKCKEMLDKYEEADRVADIKIEEGKRMFSNPFYLVGIDDSGEYLIGKFRVKDVKDGDIKATETIAPFKRYRSIEEVPELIPVMTMAKLAYEHRDVRKCHGFPVMDKYDENLDAVFYFSSTPTMYEHAFMLTPC